MDTASSKSSQRWAIDGFRVGRGAARWFALGAIAGPLLLNLAWIVLGLMRPETKDSWGVSGGITGMITQPVSGLGIGPNDWLFNAAFLLNGILMLAGVVGVFQSIEVSDRSGWRNVCAVLLALSGVGSAICGIFTIQFFIPHMIGFLLGGGLPVLSFLASGFFFRGIPSWRRFGTWLLIASPLTLALLALFFANFRFDMMAAGTGIAGLTERILVIETQVWFAAMGWLAYRRLTQVGARA